MFVDAELVKRVDVHVRDCNNAFENTVACSSSLIYFVLYLLQLVLERLN